MDFAGLHELLHSTYEEMMPPCAQMTGIAKGVAGLGALFYVACRIWQSFSRAEPDIVTMTGMYVERGIL